MSEVKGSGLGEATVTLGITGDNRYAMVDRARALGFTLVETIDCDLGKNASLGAADELRRPKYRDLSQVLGRTPV